MHTFRLRLCKYWNREYQNLIFSNWDRFEKVLKKPNYELNIFLKQSLEIH